MCSTDASKADTFTYPCGKVINITNTRGGMNAKLLSSRLKLHKKVCETCRDGPDLLKVEIHSNANANRRERLTERKASNLLGYASIDHGVTITVPSPLTD
jgi:hypothetical protein